MLELKLPLPEFKQTVAGTGASTVRVTLRNDHKQRKFFVDRDVATVIGESVAKTLNADEKRVLNFIAEHGRINVSECLRIIPTLPKWHMAKRLLESMRLKGYLIHKHSETVLRDSRAYYEIADRLSPKGNDTRGSDA